MTRILMRRVVVACSLLAAPMRAAAQSPMDVLARDVERAEAVRAVKTLQRTYAQYSQYGLWNEMAALFADEARLTIGDDAVTGRGAIAAFLTNQGGGRQGLAPGAIHTQLIDGPVVNLSPDGRAAKGRWYGFFLTADGTGGAGITGGMFENEYVVQNGGWRIRSLHFSPQFTGTYETGWTNWKGGNLPIIPYHFTADESGVPIPPAPGPAPKAAATLAQLERRIAVMNEETHVRNLQAAYGHYVNRRMWDDVVDLFATDGVYEVSGTTHRGPAGVRAALERMGPAGLSQGVLNDRLQFDTVVSIAPGGREAFARGIELGMLGEASKNEAQWEVNVFHNRFVKEDGIWKVREMRLFPILRSDYAVGWGKSRLDGGHDRVIPAFLSANPVTGKTVALPEGMRFVATAPLTGTIAAAARRAPPADMTARLEDDRRRLRMATAYDGAEHVSTTYGMYADDFQWPPMAAIFGTRGAKQIPFVGYYKSAERIARATYLEWGDPTDTRTSVSWHWRMQPVILVAADGRSASLRTYLFQPRTAKDRASGISGAMYLDQLVLEAGVWRLWSLSLNEPYFTSPDWKSGWSGAKYRAPQAPQPARPRPAPAPGTPEKPFGYFGADLVAKYPPDVAITALGVRQEHFRGGTGETWEWPMILPMWWHYKNPVSGRTPELYMPDCTPCDFAPDMSMTKHGYVLPPAGPVRSDE
ncbi:MAG TPA: nuclear transport factor 2 family protein [Vicinamibacterales bacterium]|nr:nuclear transport factor 2 family protein [Vicinamibacterales bacterium]